MRTYTLYEMVGLIRLGVWQGGMVDKLDYIGPAAVEIDNTSVCGALGVYISYDAMLERCEVSDDMSCCQFKISLYDPYTGGYNNYTLSSSISNRDYLWAKLEEVIQEIRQTYVWSHNINKTNIYHIEGRYKANYSSMRSGSIGSPRRSKLFGR